MLANPAQKIISALDDKRAGTLVRDLLSTVDVEVNGTRPWDIQIKDERVYTRVLREGTLGFGEAYMEGWWETGSLDQLCDRLFRGRLDYAVRENWVLLAHAVRARIFNLQFANPFEVGQKHYDIGNDLYERMLDKRMVYTCAYWKDAKTLDEAQEAKLDLVCRKIGLDKKPGMKVLELGCGWGSFASYAAERYGAHVTGYTVSKEQVAWAKERYAHLPVEFRLDDYRNARGIYDAVVSIGLMEHVGPKNYRGYMQLVDRCLAKDGVAFVHTIAGTQSRGQIDPWFHKYVFPNAVFPSVKRVAGAAEGILVVEDIHNIGEHYDPTLMAWWQRFDAAWPELKPRYGEGFYRMWQYYLLVSAAAFRSRSLQLQQFVFTRQGTKQPDVRQS
jgi:cyclopropane-fatty-acyl-phospholipid synthase